MGGQSRASGGAPTGVFLPFFRRPVIHGPVPMRNASTDGSWSVTRRGDVVEAGFGSGSEFPQYAAFHTDSGFLRLNWGPESDWGTSLIVLPCFWEGGRYHQGAQTSVSWQAHESCLTLSFAGLISGLHARGEVHLSAPMSGELSCAVAVTVEGEAKLDPRRGEAFKPLMLSSMHIAQDLWDVASIEVDSRRFGIPDCGWIVHPSLIGRRIVLTGGASRWKSQAPSLEIAFDRCFEMTGWKTPSADPDDDNVGFWVATEQIIRSWQYAVTARSGDINKRGDPHGTDDRLFRIPSR